MARPSAIARHSKESRNLSDNRRNILGQRGEDLAAEHLLHKGYRIIERNYRNHFGEIDIIALDTTRMPKTLVFIEVKTRKNTLFSAPSEAVTRKKQMQIIKVAMAYLSKNKLAESATRFDVVAILLPDNGFTRIDLIQNAFDLSDCF
ncbi:MAG: YraN family protein [Desulfoarculaceae bacterium]|nr:YraN family protein [Desulfoarculaceae bacterium]